MKFQMTGNTEKQGLKGWRSQLVICWHASWHSRHTKECNCIGADARSQQRTIEESEKDRGEFDEYTIGEINETYEETQGGFRVQFANWRSIYE